MEELFLGWIRFDKLIELFLVDFTLKWWLFCKKCGLGLYKRWERGCFNGFFAGALEGL